MKKLSKALGVTLFCATVILFCIWLFVDRLNISGWWWFSTFLGAVFFETLSED